MFTNVFLHLIKQSYSFFKNKATQTWSRLVEKVNRLHVPFHVFRNTRKSNLQTSLQKNNNNNNLTTTFIEMCKGHIDKIYTFMSYLLVFMKIFANCYVASTIDKGLRVENLVKSILLKKAGVHIAGYGRISSVDNINIWGKINVLDYIFVHITSFKQWL